MSIKWNGTTAQPRVTLPSLIVHALPTTTSLPAPKSAGLQTPEEERLQVLNQEIQDFREQLNEMIQDEDLWDLYERPTVKYNIIVLEDERSQLVQEHTKRALASSGRHLLNQPQSSRSVIAPKKRAHNSRNMKFPQSRHRRIRRSGPQRLILAFARLLRRMAS